MKNNQTLDFPNVDDAKNSGASLDSNKYDMIELPDSATQDKNAITKKSENLGAEKGSSLDRLMCAFEGGTKSVCDVSEKIYLSQKQFSEVLKKNAVERPFQTITIAFAMGYFARYLFSLKE